VPDVPAIDANIILRFLTNDDPDKARACAGLLARVERNEEQIWLPDLVLADVVWTLEKFYRQSKETIADLLVRLISLRGMRCSSKDNALLALSLYVRHNIDWTDAFVAAQLLAQRSPILYSYDRDFDRVSGLRRIEP